MTLPVSPAAALPAEVADRARVPPPAPVGPGPASPAAGTGGGPGGDTPTPPPQAGGGDALPNRAAAHRRSPRDRAGGGDAVTCRGLCRSPPAPLSWQPRLPHEGRQPRAWWQLPACTARAHAGVDVGGLDPAPRPRLSGSRYLAPQRPHAGDRGGGREKRAKEQVSSNTHKRNWVWWKDNG